MPTVDIMDIEIKQSRNRVLNTKRGGVNLNKKTINICEKAAAYNEIKRFVEIQVVSHESNVPNY